MEQINSEKTQTPFDGRESDSFQGPETTDMLVDYWQDILLKENVIFQHLGTIDNWFAALHDAISEYLEEDEGAEVVIINMNSEKFTNLFSMFNPQYFENEKALIAFDANSEVKAIKVFYASKVRNENTDFDRDLKKDGIIRMTN